jgi:hypothetical protein
VLRNLTERHNDRREALVVDGSRCRRATKSDPALGTEPNTAARTSNLLGLSSPDCLHVVVVTHRQVNYVWSVGVLEKLFVADLDVAPLPALPLALAPSNAVPDRRVDWLINNRRWQSSLARRFLDEEGAKVFAEGGRTGQQRTLTTAGGRDCLLSCRRIKFTLSFSHRRSQDVSKEVKVVSDAQTRKPVNRTYSFLRGRSVSTSRLSRRSINGLMIKCS